MIKIFESNDCGGLFCGSHGPKKSLEGSQLSGSKSVSWLILALSKVMLTLLGDVFLWTLAHFGTFKSYVDIVGWCFPVNVGSFWHCQKLCWHCWVMFSECFPVNVGSFWHFEKLYWHCWVMFSECFPVNVGSFWHFQSYIDIVGWCFLVNVGLILHFQKLCWHCCQRSQENITQQCQHNFWKCQNEPTFTRKHSENITQQCQHNFWKCQNEPTFTRKHSEKVITQQCQQLTFESAKMSQRSQENIRKTSPNNVNLTF